MTSVREFSPQSRCILMSACCARLGRVRPYRFWLGSWPLRPLMLSAPAGSEGRRKRGVSLLCTLCVAVTHRHMGCVCVCVSVEWALCEQMPDLERVGLGWARLCKLRMMNGAHLVVSVRAGRLRCGGLPPAQPRQRVALIKPLHLPFSPSLSLPLAFFLFTYSRAGLSLGTMGLLAGLF